MERPPNLLIIGASGGLANALLQMLPKYRCEIDTLVLLDKYTHVLESTFLSHDKLGYTFIEHEIDDQTTDTDLVAICNAYDIDIILDVTDLNTKPLLALSHALGVSYVNTMLNDEHMIMPHVYEMFARSSDAFAGHPHLLCSGMNPGIVNLWVAEAVRIYGQPSSITFFEHDSSLPACDTAPFITWSRKEFLEEAITQPSGRVRRRGRLEILEPNAISHLVDMRSLLEPIRTLQRYPIGMVMMHEEVMSVGRRLGVPTEFIYAVNPSTLAYLREEYHGERTIAEDDLVLADNVAMPLDGSDLVGVWLRYADKHVCYYNDYHNQAIQGTNATYAQVAIGVLAGLRAVLHKQVPPGLNYPEDLVSPVCAETIHAHMDVRRWIVA